MFGQWIGEYTGNSAGTIMIDIDDGAGCFEGHAYQNDIDPDMPRMSARFKTNGKSRREIVPVDNIVLTPGRISGDELKKKYPDITFPDGATVTLEEIKGSLSVSWVTSIGSLGSALIQRSQSDRPSNLKAQPKVTSWTKFWQFAVKQDPGRFLFRGQSRPWRLRTAFHRTRRKDLQRFIHVDIPDLHRVVSAKASYFDLRDELHNGAFWHLMQHHGYPTPLLDWTASPFVAAYFAYQSDPARTAAQKKVRVLMFDQEQWKRDYYQVKFVATSQPHVSLIQPLALGNERSLPQQAVSFVTNVDDIESYIRDREKQKGKQYLYAFDLPYAERDEALRQLTLMGVTAGALFPGLDGACEEMRCRHFGFGP